MRCDLLVGKNDYDVVKVFSDGLERAFLRKGVNVRKFSIESENFFRYMEILQNAPPDFTFSFSHIRVGMQPFALFSPIPHLTWIVDRGYYFLDLAPPSRSLIALVDEEDYKLFQMKANNRALFLPHAVEREYLEMEQEDKDYDIVFFGTFLEVPFIDNEIALSACEEVLRSPSLSILRALLNLGVEEDLPILYSKCDAYLRARERLELLQRLDGKNLHVFGKGNFRNFLKKAHIHPPISFEKTKAIMRKSKIVLNPSLTLKNGLHERILYGLSGYALPFSSKTSGLLSTFSKAGEWSFLSEDAIEERVERLLKDSYREELIRHSRKEVEEHHTFDHRVDSIVTFMSKLI